MPNQTLEMTLLRRFPPWNAMYQLFICFPTLVKILIRFVSLTLSYLCHVQDLSLMQQPLEILGYQHHPAVLETLETLDTRITDVLIIRSSWNCRAVLYFNERLLETWNTSAMRLDSPRTLTYSTWDKRFSNRRENLRRLIAINSFQSITHNTAIFDQWRGSKYKRAPFLFFLVSIARW